MCPSREHRVSGFGERVLLSDGRAVTIRELRRADTVSLAAADSMGRRRAGLARYTRDADERYAAQLALTVVEDQRRRGLGGALLTRLVGRARRDGIHRFTAWHADASPAFGGLLQLIGAEVVLRGRGFVTIEIAPAGPCCALCGNPIEPAAHAPAGERRSICDACLRGHVPRISADLDKPWWR
jgi:GNAT superfamily N-acetyltransferase